MVHGREIQCFYEDGLRVMKKADRAVVGATCEGHKEDHGFTENSVDGGTCGSVGRSQLGVAMRKCSHKCQWS